MLSCQLAIYPLNVTNFEETIGKLLSTTDFGNVKVQINNMSTILYGEDEKVWQAAKKLLDEARHEAPDIILNATFSTCCPGL